METTWEDTFHVTLEIFGPSTYRERQELRVRTQVENVSAEPATYVRWSEDDPAVPVWIALPRQRGADGEPQGVLRLIPLREKGYTPAEYSGTTFPQVVGGELEPGATLELEVVWDLTVRGTESGVRVPAADGAYMLRADLFPAEGLVNPGLPDVSLEFPITLRRGISG